MLLVAYIPAASLFYYQEYFGKIESVKQAYSVLREQKIKKNGRLSSRCTANGNLPLKEVPWFTTKTYASYFRKLQKKVEIITIRTLSAGISETLGLFFTL